MSQSRPLIALDAMGGDHGPCVVVPAALEILAQRPQVCLVLVGQEDRLQAELARHRSAQHYSERIQVRHAPETVGMDEAPAVALRQKKRSSMRVALNLLQQGEVSACVSAGNTGALMATARFVLRTVPGIERPAICTALPTQEGHVHMLDLGANVDSKAEHLHQFAIMGTVLSGAIDGVTAPRVGLLNIGEEDIKGNESVKRAAELLAADRRLNYVGFIEGDGVYLHQADVVVCDGFVGNIALKSSEGVAKLIRHFMGLEFRRNVLTRLSGLFARPVLRALGQRIDPRRYNGASLLGLQGIVIKSHGSADQLAFANAIRIAELEVTKAVPGRIRQYLETSGAERQVL